MTEAERQEVLAKIQQKTIQTNQDIEELIELCKPIPPENAIGRLSRMDAINNRSVNESSLRNAKSRLSKLQYALSLADSPDFGKCTRCGNEIPVGRLLFMPESMKCVNCARA